MTRALPLEDFSSGAAEPPFTDPPGPSEALEASADPDVDALDAYDSGYRSGWADSAAAEAEERRGISADLAKNLTEATMTYETARRDVLAALRPFFEDVVTTLLPRMAADAVLPCVLAELGELAEDQTRTGIELHAAPATCPSLERLLETEGIEDVAIHPEPAFSEGQVSLRLGTQRRDIDMTGAADRIAQAIAGFQDQASMTEPSMPPRSQGIA